MNQDIWGIYNGKVSSGGGPESFVGQSAGDIQDGEHTGKPGFGLAARQSPGWDYVWHLQTNHLECTQKQVPNPCGPQEPEQEPLVSDMFRLSIIETLPSPIKHKLEDVVGLTSDS